MDVALRNFPLEEKEKYVNVCKGYSYFPLFTSEFEDIASIQSSAQLPYEIQFDDDDDFEHVLPKVMSWDALTEIDCSEWSQTSLDSDFEYIDYRRDSIPNSTLSYGQKKRGLWTKVKKIFKRLIRTKGKRKQCKTTRKTTRELSHSLLEVHDWQPKVAKDLNLPLKPNGR